MVPLCGGALPVALVGVSGGLFFFTHVVAFHIGVAYRVASVISCSWLHYNLSGTIYQDGILNKYIVPNMCIFYIVPDIILWYIINKRERGVCMPVSKAQQKAVSKYMKENYDELKARIPKGQKETIKAHAEAKGESLNAFINRAISETMERDNAAIE